MTHARGDKTTETSLDFLSGGGEMGELVRSMDWSLTPLGPVEEWPQSLRTAVSTCLNSRFPMLVFWGPERIKIYNDGYAPMLGAKHPEAMGAPAREVWTEIWDVIGPMLDKVASTGEAVWTQNERLLLERHGFPEECYFTFSYSPIRDESGGIGGILDTVTETTAQVLSGRRLSTLSDVAARTAGSRIDERVCEKAAEALAENPADVPFALLYLIDRSTESARLAGHTGLPAGSDAAPDVLDLADEAASHRWPLAQVVDSGEVTDVGDLHDRFDPFELSGDAPAPHTARLLPMCLPGDKHPSAILVAGLSAQLRVDEDYTDFLDLVAGHVSTALASARTLQESRARADELAALDRQKTTFFNNVSHEFRTPLTLILGQLERALEQNKPGLEGEDLQRVYRNALRLLNLVNTLLDFSRVEAGRAQVVYEPTDLAALTSRLTSMFVSTVEDAGLSLEVECPPLDEPVFVDRDMWEKIVFNLLSNAFKFTFGGKIQVHLRCTNEQVELQVSDTGIGIPEDELPRLFDRFHRVEGARSRTHEGTGIGLALAAELAELHGGSIEVDSTVGEGTTFTVSIPTGSEHLPDEPIGDARTLDTTATSAAPYIEEARRGSSNAAAAGAPEQPADEQAARILVADDNADMRAYLRQLLEPQFSVETAANGVEALAVARQDPPDLVLSDVMMPEMDGLSLLRALRDDERTRTVPIVLLSARAGEESRVDGIASGADDYLVKPFSAKELLARLEAQLSLQHMRDAVKDEREARLAEAERNLRMSEMFVGILGHDLRNPLGAIAMGAELLRARSEHDPKLGETIDRIANSAERMKRMIDQLLDFTHTRMGTGIPLQPRHTDLQQVLSEVVAELRDQYDQADIEIDMQGDLEGVWDPDRLAQLGSNLLHNALEHRTPNSPVTIEVDGTDSERVCFEIHNHGLIPAERLPDIFEPLSGGESAPSGSSGLGLGLFITRQILLAHGGDIFVRSSEGEGTRFIAELPRKPRANQSSMV